jgi:hypothetical protein
MFAPVAPRMLAVAPLVHSDQKPFQNQGQAGPAATTVTMGYLGAVIEFDLWPFVCAATRPARAH